MLYYAAYDIFMCIIDSNASYTLKIKNATNSLIDLRAIIHMKVIEFDGIWICSCNNVKF